MTPQQECSDYLLQKIEQLASAVNMRYSGAVEGAMRWGIAQRPDLVARCDIDAEQRLGELMENGMVGEFRAACVDFFRAELELYRAHAEFLGLLEAA